MDLGGSDDIIIREIRIGKEGNVQVGIIYTDGLADPKMITDFIMESLMLDTHTEPIDQLSTGELQFEFLKIWALTIGEVQDIKDFNTLYRKNAQVIIPSLGISSFRANCHE
jgi:spore germination protein KA